MMVSSLDEWLALSQQAEALVKATDPKEVADLEARFGINQQAAVAHILESTAWGVETFPEYQEGKGEFHDRLASLRSKWGEWERA